MVATCAQIVQVGAELIRGLGSVTRISKLSFDS